MFLAIFNWMLANTPAFLRPGVRWLVEGIRRITNYVSSRWNALGNAVLHWGWRVLYWKDRLINFAAITANALRWLKNVYVPTFALRVANLALQAAANLVNTAKAVAASGLATLRLWAQAAINAVTAFASTVKTVVTQWVNDLKARLATLIAALRPVLQGPAFLAEWLAGHMAKTLLRFIFGQRDRIAQWLTRESVAFQTWLARELETVLVRWL